MCPGRVRGGTQGRVEARPAWGNYRMPTGEAGTEEGGPTSLLLLGKFSQGVVVGGGPFPEFVTIPESIRFLVLPRKLDPKTAERVEAAT